MYGGLFSDTPPVEPTEFSLWAYDVESGKWSDVTSETKVSPDSGSKEIQRAAEGAGATVPGRSLGFYFGGHLDGYTTKGWSQSIPRVYLKSLLEFDMETKTFRNVTGSGLEKAGVPERADGVLVFVSAPQSIMTLHTDQHRFHGARRVFSLRSAVGQTRPFPR